MRKTIIILAAALFCMLPCTAQTKVTFMPQWTAQSQFAGYYIALNKGFYAEEGLDVTIEHLYGGSKKTSFDHMKAGNADIISLQLISAIVLKSNGEDIMNVLQTSQNSGIMLVSHAPVRSIRDLEGKKVGRWKSGFSETALMATQRDSVNVTWIDFLNGVNLFLSHAIDATLCYSYNEYLRILLCTGGLPESQCLRFSDLGYNYPEDGLYVSSRYYKRNRDTVNKFVHASKRGWNYVRQHPDEALEIVRQVMQENKIPWNYILQKLMLEETLRLQEDHRIGKATFAPVSSDTFSDIIRDCKEIGLLKKDIELNSFINVK